MIFVWGDMEGNIFVVVIFCSDAVVPQFCSNANSNFTMFPFLFRKALQIR